ncbi:MAG: LamG-like jellyroll fold domain-containing protein [Pirellulales bacterium]
MSLSDRDILELNELCDATVEGTLTAAQRVRLEQLLADSEDARRYYVKAMDLSASLGQYAGEMQMEAADVPSSGTHLWESKSVRWAALAAALALTFTWWLTSRPTDLAKSISADLPEYVARLTGTKDAVWPPAAAELAPGDFLRRGQRLSLKSGFAEVTFDSGAIVLLEGPAVFDVTSAWDATLLRGAIKANVPSQALGFRVSNRAVEVIDIGTEFSMFADDRGGADVLVLKGEVEAMPSGDEDSEAIVLQANESRRFARAGVTVSEDPAQMRARFSARVPLERQSDSVRYVQWSFDELQGKISPAKVAGFPLGDYHVKLIAPSPSVRHTALVDGFRQKALRFEGLSFARAEFPGLSGNFPRTIAFWVKVPNDSPLSGAYSMVAWRGDADQLASRPVHIGWNRQPTEGPLGAIRTDFSGGHAMGTTPLRDGRWHHIAVIFLLSDDPTAPVQVKQYVDGRLESNAVTSGPKRSVRGNVRANDNLSGSDRLWLGCRLGAVGPKKERFLGEIDELVVWDRGLEPVEIVALMDGHMTLATQRAD